MKEPIILYLKLLFLIYYVVVINTTCSRVQRKRNTQPPSLSKPLIFRKRWIVQPQFRIYIFSLSCSPTKMKQIETDRMQFHIFSFLNENIYTICIMQRLRTETRTLYINIRKKYISIYKKNDRNYIKKKWNNVTQGKFIKYKDGEFRYSQDREYTTTQYHTQDIFLEKMGKKLFREKDIRDKKFLSIYSKTCSQSRCK